VIRIGAATERYSISQKRSGGMVSSRPKKCRCHAPVTYPSYTSSRAFLTFSRDSWGRVGTFCRPMQTAKFVYSPDWRTMWASQYRTYWENYFICSLSPLSFRCHFRFHSICQCHKSLHLVQIQTAHVFINYVLSC